MEKRIKCALVMTDNNLKSVKIKVDTWKILKRLALDSDEKLYQTIARLSKEEMARTTGKRVKA